MLLIAVYDDENFHTSQYYAGIIAEPPLVRNNLRWVRLALLLLTGLAVYHLPLSSQWVFDWRLLTVVHVL